MEVMINGCRVEINGLSDIIAYKKDGFRSQNNYYAIEIKTNTGSLSNLQKIRLGLLKKDGLMFQMMDHLINVMLMK